MSETREYLTGGGRTTIYREGATVHRQPGPWSTTVLDFLRYLGRSDFEAAPKVVGSGFDADGFETVEFLEGEFVHPNPWTENALYAIGAMLRTLHTASQGYDEPANAVWQDWHGRELGQAPTVVGHCDFAPWNIVVRDGMPVGLIDWETAGPVDPIVELAQVCWLNAQLHDDDVGERVGLAPPEVRAQHASAICAGYALPLHEVERLVEMMVAVAIFDAAEQAQTLFADTRVSDADGQWAVAWRIRAAKWITRHKKLLIRTIQA